MAEISMCDGFKKDDVIIIRQAVVAKSKTGSTQECASGTAGKIVKIWACEKRINVYCDLLLDPTDADEQMLCTLNASESRLPDLIALRTPKVEPIRRRNG